MAWWWLTSRQRSSTWTSGERVGFDTWRGVLAHAEGRRSTHSLRPQQQPRVAKPEPGRSNLNLAFLCVNH